MKCARLIFVVLVAGLLIPGHSYAQGASEGVGGLHAVLDKLMDDMMPLCSELTGIGQAIGGFAAIWYISSRVWGQIARAESVDLYPLLRPFVITILIGMFPQVLNVMNGVLKPTVTATAAIVHDSDTAIAVLLQEKEQAIKETDVYKMYVGADGKGDKDKWYKYYHPNDTARSKEGMFERIGNDLRFSIEQTAYGIKNSIKQFMSEVLQVLFQAASLCVNTVRIFYLIVLAILGPLVFGLSILDGFQQSIVSWIGRYINYYMWLPVANIFGAIINKIQINMIKLDVEQIKKYGDTAFGANDTAYIIFLIMGIIGYFTVPSIAGYIIHVGGANPLLQKITGITTSVASGGAGRIAQGAANIANAPGDIGDGLSGKSSGSGLTGSIGRAAGNAGSHMYDSIAGK
ncbi:conjugative transposon protein TraJ [Chitinophaga silvatica]|uniref:Conjugative transposon protein TraJ n=1 Tax=Chitinophaga silvatica TaxID=2282649 RepID=A0A3E1YI00_9BACT|nr:conjugative transposon protein TraJ [Chitinophaga silvatica]RFS27053.1 conjugative transposon protein TraJ [Chitinophaga silvatica]